MNLPNETGKFSQNTELIKLLDELRNTLYLYNALVEAKEGIGYQLPPILSSISIPLDIANELSNLTTDFVSEKLTTLIEQQLQKAILIINQIKEV